MKAGVTKCLWWIGCVLLAAFESSGAEAPAKRPITHHDVWTFRRLGGPAVSPDGKWAVLSVTQPAYDQKDESSDLWIVAVNAETEPRRLTATKMTESGVAWSPDSQKIVFSSKREGDDVAQLYLLDLASGGDAERITQIPTGGRSASWSPDGKYLVFLSDVYPETKDTHGDGVAEKRSKDRKYNVRAFENFPVRRWDRWLDDRRAHIFVQEAQAGAAPVDLLAGTKLSAEPGFGGLLSDSGEEIPTTWSPDGKSIVFVASRNRDAAAYSKVNTSLFEIPAAGGEPVELTPEDGNYGRARFAPDGKSLVVTYTPNDKQHEYSLRRIVWYPWPFDAARRRILTGDLDRVPNEPVFSADGEHIYFTVEDAGLEKLYSASIGEGKTRLEYEPPAGIVGYLSAGAAAENFRLVMLWGSATKPAEVFSFLPGQSKPKPLSHFNTAQAAALDLYPVEHYSIRTAQGESVHSLIIRPAGFDPNKKYPVIALVHGGPHSMARDSFSVDWNYHLFAGTEYVIVATNYLGSTGFGESFARGVQGNPLKGPAGNVIDTMTAVTEHFGFVDRQRIAAVGASYGGHIVNWIEATTTQFRCLVAHAGMVNPETQWGTSDMIYDRELLAQGPVWEQSEVWRSQSAVRLAGNHASKSGWITPILVSGGEKDFRVPLNNVLEEWNYLQRLRVPSRLLVFPEEGHVIAKGEDSRYWYGEVQAWLKRWLDHSSAAP
ncbi:MAG TPA: S9 family peptidase [Opitutaceae bacterium]|nr:S9 family peptidase [Opitutaceae bacterium]